jgi:hypothetical protein
MPGNHTNGPLLEDYRRAVKAAKKEGWREVTVKFPNGQEITLKEGDDPAPAIKPPDEALPRTKANW